MESSKWHAIIQGGFGGKNKKKERKKEKQIIPGINTNSPICKIQFVKAKKR